MSYTITRRLSETGDNRLDAKDRAVHDWYRFVLAYPPHLVHEYLQEFGLFDHGGRVLDPFSGTGTTLVEAKKHGVASVGIEANPMAEFAARVKVDWRPEPEGLRAYARHIEQRALAELRAQGIEDEPSEAALSFQDSASLMTLPDEELGLLLTDSISERPLHKALVLLRAMEAECDPAYDAHARWRLPSRLWPAVAIYTSVRRSESFRSGPTRLLSARGAKVSRVWPTIFAT